MKTRMMAVIATLALFAVAGTFVLSSAVPMTIPTNDPHSIPTNDPHCVSPVFDLSGLFIPT
ncbi:MAG: hypothetical protein LUQ55_04865, partial [Methanomassiliicoccales archaeon]|nr:hypothetical protein [Methanomassiliicoccales archaeon]